MDTIFPFSYPAATAFYLVLFVSTLVLHVLFMNYVLAGSAWLAWSLIASRLRTGKKDFERYQSDSSRCDAILYDWIPSMLSAAITAGVAPLLFLQILYQRDFYTANLLLFHRWMSILPILIIGFYALYLLRTYWISKRSSWVQKGIGVVPFVCVLFVAYSWTENHSLSLQSEEYWHQFYEDEGQIYFDWKMIPRLGIWTFGSFTTLSAWLAWQLYYHRNHGTEVESLEWKKLTKVAAIGMVGSAVCALGFLLVAPGKMGLFFRPSSLIYSITGLSGLLMQLWGWSRIHRSGNAGLRTLLCISIGLVMTIFGLTVCREIARLEAMGAERISSLYSQHAQAASFEGFGLFVFFLLLNAVLIASCFWIVKRNWNPPESKMDSIEP